MSLSATIPSTTMRSPRLTAALRVLRGHPYAYDQSTISGYPPAPRAYTGRIGGRSGLFQPNGNQQIRTGIEPARCATDVGTADACIRCGLPAEGLAKGPLTQARLKHLLHYDPNTGVFTWRVDRPRIRAGDRAGKLAKDGYVEIGVDGRRYMAHRLAVLYMDGAFPDLYVDHINRDTSDNRWVNLRLATNSQNQMNVTKKSSNTSGFKGVIWHKGERRWRADIRVGGKKKTLGLFKTAELAYAAYCEAAKVYHGEFARLN